MPEFRFTFPLEGGLHARPAAALRERAQDLGAAVDLVNDRTGRSAPLAHLLGLLGTDTRAGDPCRLRAHGPGAEAALAALAAFLEGAFLACDTPGEAAAPRGRAGTAIGRLLAGAPAVEGAPLAPGVGAGPVCRWRPAWPEADDAPAPDPVAEREALARALAQVRCALGRTAAKASGARAAVLNAQAAMLEDPGWLAAAEAHLGEGKRAAAAVAHALGAARADLALAPNPMIRERALDLRDLEDRLRAELSGTAPAAPALAAPGVLLAADLTPSALLALDRAQVRALVLADGSPTSHTAILARSFGIPCVACAGAADLDGAATLLVDGERGLAVPDPPPALTAYYAVQARERALPAAAGPCASADGVSFTLLANLLGPAEAAGAFRAGAEGVGLFRSEMLFLDRDRPPTEEEQYQAYRTVLEAAGGRPVVLRLLDVGGDKPLPYLPLPAEANPQLGRRGVRWYGQHPELVRTQLRAAVRARAHGDLRLMLPMVSEASEVLAARALLEAEGGAGLPLGIMLEVPAAALNAGALSAVADFFSIGSNDLVQYLFAADRGDAGVARPRHDWHPATLRTLARIAADARVPVSLCGELAGRPALLPLLVGLGLRTFSMAPGQLAGARRALAALDASRCRALAEAALAAGSAEEVEALMAATPVIAQRPLLDPGLVVLDAALSGPEEALKLLAERCAALGRARDPLALEEALWAREATYSTGVGFGFAVPHCKDASVLAPTLGVLRLAKPIAWGDGQPVDVLLLLITGAGDGGETHLRVFARLARKLMDEAFRDALRRAPGAAELLETLAAHVL